MAGSFVHPFDRGLLGTQGLQVTDAEYARAVAALGLVPTAPPLGDRPERDQDRHLRWELATFERNVGDYRNHPPHFDIRSLNDLWMSALRGEHESRRVVVAAGPGNQELRSQPGLAAIAGILSHPAVEARVVSIDWSNALLDPRWQWPLRIGAFDAEDFEQLGLRVLASLWPAHALTQQTLLDRDNARVEILAVDEGLRGALRRIYACGHRVRAGFVLAAAPLDVRWDELRVQVEAVLAETQAGGIGIVQLESGESLPEVINEWIGELSHAVPLDVAFGKSFGPARSLLVLDRRLVHAAALRTAARSVGRRLQQLPADAPVVLPPSTPARVTLDWPRAAPPAALGAELEARVDEDTFPFTNESQGATAVVEIAAATRVAERATAVSEAPRYLQGEVYRLATANPVLETRGLVEHERHAIEVFIGAAGLATLRADVAVPDHLIDWETNEPVTLQVLFVESDQPETPPQRGTITLPRSGRSTSCRFEFKPGRTGPYGARIVLYYRGRVLQTALLETRVVATATGLDTERQGGMTLRVEATLRRSLSTVADRRRFDAFMVCNHSPVTRKAAITSAAKDGAYVASLANLGTVLANVSDLLTAVARDDARYRKGLTSKANAELLGKLAIEGNALYRTLVTDYIGRSSSARQIVDGEYLQVVTMDPDAIVPLEFVYDYKVPADDAPVCRNAAKALRVGACPASCKPTRSPAPHVCPLGFWGLSKVIERHIHVPDLAKASKVLASEPLEGRDELSLDGSTLLGVSQEVGRKGERALIKQVGKLRGKAVTTAANWQAWVKAVESIRPVLLVALPHTAGSGGDISLEIGGDTCKSRFIDCSYVRADTSSPPVALLLGCDTANTADTASYLHHVGVFRQADAALVVGTVATVLGTTAADMAARLVKHLQAAIKARKSARFGEVLRTAKREAVADSQMIGLCLAAFGDADWRLDLGE
jgi:hypothetical protein